MIFSLEKDSGINSKSITICGTGRESLELFFYCYQLKAEVKQFISEEFFGIQIFSRDVIKLQQWEDNRTEQDLLLGSMESQEEELLKKRGHTVYTLQEISNMHSCSEHEYIVDHAKYRETMEQLKTADASARFVMDTLKYRKKLVLLNGELLRKESVFQFIKQVLDGKHFTCIGDDTELAVMRELFEYFGIEAVYHLKEKEAVGRIEYSPDTEILFYSDIDEELGKELEKKGYAIKVNIKIFLFYVMIEIYERDILLDMDLGYNFSFSGSRYIGFKEYGDFENASLKIVALGNSTTDGRDIEPDESWPYYLYQMLKNKIAGVSVLNAGAPSYNISDELLKFIRDVSPLKPDLVISYTGWINIAQRNEYPFTNTWRRILNNLLYVKENENLMFKNINQEKKYSGMQNSMSRYQYFLMHAKQLQAAAAALGIGYKCFVQPNIYTKNELAFSENARLIYYDSIHQKENSKEFFAELKEDIHKYKWLYDYSGIFDDARNVYKDTHHVYKEGNEIIAGRIFEDIQDLLK